MASEFRRRAAVTFVVLQLLGQNCEAMHEVLLPNSDVGGLTLEGQQGLWKHTADVAQAVQRIVQKGNASEPLARSASFLAKRSTLAIEEGASKGAPSEAAEKKSAEADVPLLQVERWKSRVADVTLGPARAFLPTSMRMLGMLPDRLQNLAADYGISATLLTGSVVTPIAASVGTSGVGADGALHSTMELRAPDDDKMKRDEQQMSIQAQIGQAMVFGVLSSIVACFYAGMKVHPPLQLYQSDEERDKVPDGRFKHGLFSCCEEPGITCVACCCSPIRWADTLRMANILDFWPAFFMMTVLSMCRMVMPAAGVAMLCMTFLGVYYRQKIRVMFNMPAGDCDILCFDFCTYLCCFCCVVIQEARQLESAYQGKHPSVEAPLEQ